MEQLRALKSEEDITRKLLKDVEEKLSSCSSSVLINVWEKMYREKTEHLLTIVQKIASLEGELGPLVINEFVPSGSIGAKRKESVSTPLGKFRSLTSFGFERVSKAGERLPDYDAVVEVSSCGANVTCGKCQKGFKNPGARGRRN